MSQNLSCYLLLEYFSSNLETGGVPGPGALVTGVQQAVAQQDKVAGPEPLARDLVQLPLLD